MNALELAQSMVGTKEGDAKLNDYLHTGGQNLDPVDLAWCAAFVNATLEQSGYGGSGSNLARSFLDYGSKVDPAGIQPGDIGVWPRGNDPTKGHVGLVQAYDPKTGQITLVSGNTSDQVGVGTYSAEKALGFRRPGNTGTEDPRLDTPSTGHSVGSTLPGPAAPGTAGAPPAATPAPPPVATAGASDFDPAFAAGISSMGGSAKFPALSQNIQPKVPNRLPPFPPVPITNTGPQEQLRARLAQAMQRLNSGSLQG